MKKISIGRLTLGTVPRVVGTVTTVAALRRLAAGRVRDADIVEVRLDLVGADLDDWPRLCRRIEKSGTPVVLTIRDAREGGAWKGAAAKRLALYEKASAIVSAIDVEIRSSIFARAAKAAHRRRAGVIGSFHDFKGTPPAARLRDIIRRGRKGGADIVKIATRAERAEDLITLNEILRAARGGPLCALGMGRLALCSRFALPCAGSCLTYGFLDRAAAPGQVSCRKLAARLREAAAV